MQVKMPLRLILFLLVGFNAFDAVTTLYVLNNGLGVELNPLMRLSYELSPWFFAAVKTFATSASVYLIWTNREAPEVRFTAAAVTAMYTGLFLYQVGGIIWYIFL